jgi:hypothetical protein
VGREKVVIRGLYAKLHWLAKPSFAAENNGMSDLISLSIPASTAGTTEAAAPVYRYLMQQPAHWMRQAFFVGRPKLPVSRVVESMQANSQNLEDAALDWSLPVSAVEEALDYYRRFRDVIEADAAEEVALSMELARPNRTSS